jgi:hypothetical protein
MLATILQKLRARQPFIARHWEALLRVEPVNGPLANPDTLVHLIPQSMEAVFAALGRPLRAYSIPAPKDCLLDCRCGNNPYIAFYTAAEQAWVEALVLIQFEQPPFERDPGEVAAIKFVLRHLARDEIDAFCGICVHRGKAAHCRHAVAPT